MARRTKAEKANDQRIESAYRRECSGISIPVMSIPEVFKAGYEAIAAGADDAELGRTLRTVALMLSEKV